jgi:hypothetical protein
MKLAQLTPAHKQGANAPFASWRIASLTVNTVQVGFVTYQPACITLHRRIV